MSVGGAVAHREHALLRLGPERALTLYVLVMLLALVAAGLSLWQFGPAPRKLGCDEVPCALPAVSVPSGPNAQWRGSLGVRLVYPTAAWTANAGAKSLRLRSGGVTVDVVVERGGKAEQVLDHTVSNLRDAGYWDLRRNSDPARLLLGPGIATVPGVGADYCGTTSAGVGAQAQADVVVLAAVRGGRAVVVTVETDDCHQQPDQSDAFRAVDRVLNTVRWDAVAP